MFISGFWANDSDCEHRAIQPKHVRDYPVLHKTSRKETGEEELGEYRELPQHKVEVPALAVITVTPLPR